MRSFLKPSRLLCLCSWSLLDGAKGWGQMILRDGWKCECRRTSYTIHHPYLHCRYQDFFLAACDVEGNFMVVKVRTAVTGVCLNRINRTPTTNRPISTPPSFLVCCLTREFFHLLFVCLLCLARQDFSWAIPVCIFFSYFYMRPKYHWTQLLVCLFFQPFMVHIA